MVLSPQRTTLLDEIESAEVMPRPSEHVVARDTIASQEVMTQQSTPAENGEVDTGLLELGAELRKQAVINTPIVETEPGVRTLTAVESNLGVIFKMTELHATNSMPRRGKRCGLGHR
jgi:hypothetical protein